MPIEARPVASARPEPQSLGHAYLEEIRHTFENAVCKIAHCLDQLEDRDMSWRPHESHNSIQNILLHLCGNVRQWVVNAVTGAPDRRDRPAEFSDRTPRSKAELLALLRGTVAEANAAMASLDPARLLERRRIQGFDTYLLAAILDSASHFVGHTHQVVYIARMRLGDRYQFQFVPASHEQGAPA